MQNSIVTEIMDITDEDGSAVEMDQVDLRNNNQPRFQRLPQINVNHTYNIHYPEDHPSFDRTAEIEHYGEELVRGINRKTVDEVENEITSPIELPEQPTVKVSPRLVKTRYYYGGAGVKGKPKYAADGNYRKPFKRTISGEVIDLTELHSPETDSPGETQCNHVAIVGPTGCGKTVLAKRYSKMVLERQVPALQNIEAVHYIDVSKLYQGEPVTVANMLLERMIVFMDEKVYKYGMRWIDQNRDSVLFVFDGVDDVLKNFSSMVPRINYQSETTIEVMLENIITGHILKGCKTLITAREWAVSNLKGDQRPQRLLVVEQISEENQKIELTKSLLPGLQGEEMSRLIKRCFPMAFQLLDLIIFQYFAISSFMYVGQQNGNEISSDVQLVSLMMQAYMRSSHSSEEVDKRIRKLKPLALDMMKNGLIRFTAKELRRHKDLETSDMTDFVVMAPSHQQCVAFRLLPSDFSYHFSNQVIYEFFAAAAVTDLSVEDFEKLISDKLHTDQWVVVRRLLCGFLLNAEVKNYLMIFVKNRPDKKLASLLKLSLQEQVKNMHQLTPLQQYELFASLHECGEDARDIITTVIRNITLSGLALSPSDLYIVSRIWRYIDELQSAELCLGKEINLTEFQDLVSNIVKKCDNCTLDIARIDITLEHVDVVKNVIRKNKERNVQLCLIVNENTSQGIMSRFPETQTSTSQFHLVIKMTNPPPDKQVGTS